MSTSNLKAIWLAILIVVAVYFAVAQPIRPGEADISKKHPPRVSVQVGYKGFWPKVRFLDEERVLVAGDYQAQYEIRAVKDGALLTMFPEKQDNLLFGRYRLSADRKWLATPTWLDPAPGIFPKQLCIIVWEVSTGKRRATATFPSARLLDLSPDGQAIALFQDADWPTIEKLPILAARLVAGGATEGGIGSRVGDLAVRGLDLEKSGGRIIVWDILTNKRLRTSTFTFPVIDVAAFSPDGTWLVVSARNDLAYWKWQEGNYKQLHVGRRIPALAFSPDSRLLAEGPDFRTTLEVRDLSTLKVVQSVQDELRSPLYAGGIAFGRDGRTLISGNGVTLVETIKVPHRIHFWDIKSGKLKRQIALDWGIPTSLDVSPSGNSLAVLLRAGNNTRLAIWELMKE